MSSFKKDEVQNFTSLNKAVTLIWFNIGRNKSKNMAGTADFQNKLADLLKPKVLQFLCTIVMSYQIQYGVSTADFLNKLADLTL